MYLRLRLHLRFYAQMAEKRARKEAPVYDPADHETKKEYTCSWCGPFSDHTAKGHGKHLLAMKVHTVYEGHILFPRSLISCTIERS